MCRAATLFYDGECPLCSRYVTALRLQEHLTLELVNVRDTPEHYILLRDAGLDLDEGMVLELDGHRYHGSACMHRLALLSTPLNLFNRFNRWLFQRPLLSRALYPVLVASRNLLLKALRRRRLSG